MRTPHPTHVQLDELRLKPHGVPDLILLWIARDAGPQLIPAFTLGVRTQDFTHTGRPRYRLRTSAQAAGLTRRQWSVLEVLNLEGMV